MSLKEISPYLVENDEDEDASNNNRRAVSRYRLYRKTIDGRSDSWRINNAVASKTSDFAISPCDLDEDGLRDYLVETHTKKLPFQLFLFRGAGGEPIEWDFSQEGPMDMNSEPADSFVWIAYSPDTDNVGAIGFYEGHLVGVDLDPFSEMDGLFFGALEGVKVTMESSGKTWTCISSKNLQEREPARKYYIPTRIYQEMGFINEDGAETWIRVPEPEQRGIPGKKRAKNRRVTIIEHRDGYYKIKNPDSPDAEEEKAPDLWLRDSLVGKFPE